MKWPVEVIAFLIVSCLSHLTSTFGNDDLACDAAVSDTHGLQSTEPRWLPAPLQPGTSRFRKLEEYYWDQNRELYQRLLRARKTFELETLGELRWLTLVSGGAGVGKTFLKHEVFHGDYPDHSVCKLDIRELYEQWEDEGLTIMLPDLHAGDIILNRLPARRDHANHRLTRYLEAAHASFYVIDSLDEIHTDDYLATLAEIEQFVRNRKEAFTHVVVFGRGLAFHEYWSRKGTHRSGSSTRLFRLSSPHFVTTGDLLVSSWNYHRYRFDLAWAPDGSVLPMPLREYRKWTDEDFRSRGRFASVTFQPNHQMTTTARTMLQNWAKNYPIVCGMLSNLAGNGIVREICADTVQHEAAYDEQAITDAYLAAWLRRETRRSHRPSSTQPDHLDLYLRLLEELAAKYVREGKVDQNGYFTVDGSDIIALSYGGQPLRFPVHRIMDHSGLERIESLDIRSTRYRFEPFWVHRVLVERYNQRRKRQAEQRHVHEAAHGRTLPMAATPPPPLLRSPLFDD